MRAKPVRRTMETTSTSSRGLRAAPPLRLLATALASLAACTAPQFAPEDGGEQFSCGVARCDDDLVELPADASGPVDTSGRADAADVTHDADASSGAPADAGTLEEGDASGGSEGEAGVVVGQTELSPRELLKGKYAVRARFYGKDVATGTQYLSQQLIWLAEVRDSEDGGLELLARVCEDRGEGTGLFVTQKISAIMRHPEHVAVRRFTIDLEGDTFGTRSEPFLIGYKEPPAECQGQRGESLVTSEGTCVCPTSTQPPTRVNDCRVYDSDKDGNPGYAVELTGGINRVDHVRHKDQSQLKNGKVASDQHHTATYSYNHDHYTLDCGQRDCPTSEYQPCLLEESQALFYPLDELAPNGSDWTCDEVLERSETGEFFPLTPLARNC